MELENFEFLTLLIWVTDKQVCPVIPTDVGF